MTGVVISGETRGGVGDGGKAAAGAFRQAAATIGGKLQQAWNAGDAKALSDLFGEKADFIGMGGGQIAGRDKILEAHTRLFKESAGKGKAEFRLVKVKPITQDVVAALYGQRITVTDGGKSQTLRSRPSAILRRVGQDWKIVMYQVTRVSGAAAEAAPAPAKADKAAAEKPAATAKKPAKGK